MNLKQTLTENWPIDRAIVSCGVCGEELYDTKKSPPHISGPSYLTTLIKRLVSKHEGDTGHRAVDIGIDVSAPVKDIDCNITINET